LALIGADDLILRKEIAAQARALRSLDLHGGLIAR
jgi:hypothetical protein